MPKGKAEFYLKDMWVFECKMYTSVLDERWGGGLTSLQTSVLDERCRVDFLANTRSLQYFYDLQS